MLFAVIHICDASSILLHGASMLSLEELFKISYGSLEITNSIVPGLVETWRTLPGQPLAVTLLSRFAQKHWHKH